MSDYTFAAYVWSSLGALGLAVPAVAALVTEARGRTASLFCAAHG